MMALILGMRFRPASMGFLETYGLVVEAKSRAGLSQAPIVGVTHGD